MSQPVRKSARLADAAAVKNVDAQLRELVDVLWVRYVSSTPRAPVFKVFRAASNAITALDKMKCELAEGKGVYQHLSEDGRKRVAENFAEQEKLLLLVAGKELQLAGITRAHLETLVREEEVKEATYVQCPFCRYQHAPDRWCELNDNGRTVRLCRECSTPLDIPRA